MTLTQDESPGRAARYQRWLDPTRFLRVLDDDFYRMLVEIQHHFSLATMVHWDEAQVRTVHLPVTTTSISSPMGIGSDSEPVLVNLCGVDTYLADSMQFALEYACRLSPNGAFYLMPSFRGENADATHLCQFFHSEAELPGDLDSVMMAAERYLRAVTRHLLERCGAGIAAVAGSTSHLTGLLTLDRFERITFDEAARLLAGTAGAVRHGDGWRSVTRIGERELMRMVGGPVWLTHWDHLGVPFYQALDEDGVHARNADLLLGLGETIGCGERHRSGEQVRAALRAHRVGHSDYEWYVRMKDAYPLRTAGFGMGVERYLAWLLQLTDVRDLQLMPRFNGHPSAP
jgi:asparaginyl-tRNA synthetase